MQQIEWGIGNLSRALSGCGKVLLVCDSAYPYLSIREDIERSGAALVKFDQFTPNPLYEDVCKGIELFHAEGCDAILAVGGGSSIDVAKCIKLYCKMNPDVLYMEQEYRDTGVKLIAIPTTAGTGSESTCYAVIYHEGKKQSITHESIVPDVAILEPKVLKTLPVYQKKCTMLDALCQGMESWWSVNSTETSKRHSRAAVETIVSVWRDYIYGNTDRAAEKMMEASNRAGQAICITQTTAPHAFSYKITSMYGLPHGHAVAVCLPGIWRYMVKHPERCIDKRGEGYLAQTFGEIAKALGAEHAEQAIGKFEAMFEEMDMAYPQGKNMEEEIGQLSRTVNPVRLKNNPVELNAAAIEGLYREILEKGQPVKG